MDRRDRVRLAILHQETEIVPYHIWYTPPVKKYLQRHYRTEDVDEAMGNHLFLVQGKSSRPLYANPKVYGDLTEDKFGVVWRNTPYDRGHVYKCPLKEPTLKGYKFPDPKRPGRFDHVAETLEVKSDVFAIGVIGDLWERCYFMMEFTRLIRTLFTAPDFVEELLDRLTEYNLATLDELSHFSIDGVL